MVTFTSGVFLIAYALQLGASNFVIGLLAAIGPLAQLMQLPAIYVVERFRNRRAIVVLMASISRLCWLFIGLIPFLFSPQLGLGLLLSDLIINSTTGAVSDCGWNSWMRDMIPQDILGRFFSRRMQIAVGIYALHRLAMIREVGEVEEKVNLQELATEVKLQIRTISTMAGLRHMFSVPVLIPDRLRGKKGNNDHGAST